VSDPEQIEKTEAFWKGDEYIEIVIKQIQNAFWVRVLQGTRGGQYKTIDRKSFATRDAAETSAERHRLEARQRGFTSHVVNAVRNL
jgi:hypothetical protein